MNTTANDLSSAFGGERDDGQLLVALEPLPLAVTLVDSKLRVRGLNRLARAALGDVESPVGDDFGDFVRRVWPEPLAAEVVARVRHTLATGEPYIAPTWTAPRARLDRVESYEWQLHRVRLPDGSYGTVCYFQDVTRVREAELLLAAAAHRDAFLLALNDRLRSLSDPNAIMSAAAESFSRELGLARAGYGEVEPDGDSIVIGGGYSDGELPEFRGKYRLSDFGAGFGAVLRAGTDLFIEDITVDPRGPPGGSDATRVLAEVQRGRAETDLRETQARLQLALDASKMGTFVWHVDEDRIEADARVLKLLGAPPVGTSDLGSLLDDVIHPDDRARYARAVRAAADPSGTGTLREDFRVVHGDGSLHWLAITAQMSFDAPGRAGRLVGMLADITERKAIEETLREREERLRDGDRRKDEFLAILAHELRNPLGPIRTGLELTRLAGTDAAALERVRSMMERQVSHMVRLIDDLLDVSRITSGKIRLQRQPASLESMVHTAIDANRDALIERHIAFRVSLPEVPILLDVDPTRFVQIVSNLLNNAVKFTRAGGGVEIVARPERPFLSLTVSDTGIGISRELLSRVFDLFAQGEESSSSQAGLGIGLALARRLVELHGGMIEAQSPGPGCGSTFTIRMPLASAPVESAVPEPSIAPAELRRRVVVIDDNVDAADSLKMFVSALGSECRVAYDGERGLKQVVEFRPHLVLLDIGMPRIDGYETCRRIRKQLGANVVIVAISGWGQERDKLAARKAGFDAHLTKPVDPVLLKGLLAEADVH